MKEMMMLRRGMKEMVDGVDEEDGMKELMMLRGRRRSW